jgi:phosphoglycolate phosphatase-like HAD superfamily hydrolase
MRMLLLFDIDGTLLDAAGAGRTSFYQALETHFPSRLFDQVPMAGRTDYGLWHELAGSVPSNGSAPSFEDFLETYASCLQERLLHHPPLEIPGSSALLAFLAGCEDMVPCLVTGNIREGARHKLAALGWWDRFARAGEWAAYGHGTATKRTLALDLLERYRACHPEPFRAVFLGDTLADLESAEHAQIPCIVVNGNRPDEDFLARGAVACWQDFDRDPEGVVADLRRLAASWSPRIGDITPQAGDLSRAD